MATGGTSVSRSAPPERLPYMPGIDGLRAIAVIAVLLYHAEFTWMKGGFLGVEVFFVISGYLITLLLLLEGERNGRVNLREFWMRRARRLLPALFTLLFVVSLVAVVAVRDSVYRLGRDALAAIGYSTNWYLIGTEDSYFEAFGRPPLLQHLWSLSVEEQFYLLWPLLLVGGLAVLGWRRNGRLARHRMVVVVMVGVVVSTTLMWIWYVPFEDPSRIYYGTDTRAAGLLLGSALAFVWQPWRLPQPRGTGERTVLNIVGFSALGILLLLNAAVSEFGPFLYRGGFLVVAVTTTAVIATAVHPKLAVGSILSGRALRWIGTRSYGIYLWHWPVFAITRPGIDVDLGTTSAFVLRVSLTLAFAEASYRLIEVPIRRHGFRGWLQSIGSRLAPTPSGALAWGSAAITVTAVVVGLGLVAGTGSAAPALLASPLEEPGRAALVVAPSPAVDAVTGPEPMRVDRPATASGPISVRSGSDAPASTEMDRSRPTATPSTTLTLLIGDSVMLGAEPAVREELSGDIVFDSVVSRQMKHTPEVIATALGAHPNIDMVVIHLGTNGAFNSETFDRVMAELIDIDLVVFVNSRVPRRWEGIVNSALESGTERWENAELLDWKRVADAHAEWFKEDRVHLSTTGRQSYARLIAGAIDRASEAPINDADR